MQIVIDMPKGTFESVKRYYEQNQECYALCAYVANGTPLPKGHGRLIDADDIALIDEQFYISSDYYVAESAIDDAPTIIEADTESDLDAIEDEFGTEDSDIYAKEHGYFVCTTNIIEQIRAEIDNECKKYDRVGVICCGLNIALAIIDKYTKGE